MLRNDENIRHGRLLAALILNASAAANLDLRDIQFNFCLQDSDGNPLISPASREKIRDCIKAYLLSEESHSQLSDQDHQKLAINLSALADAFPDDAANLHEYPKTLQLRGASFHEAAMLMLDHSGKSAESIHAVKEKIAALKTAFENQLLILPATNEVQQARYDGYIKALTSLLAVTLNQNTKEITKNLKEAETIVNIKPRKAHITISGKIHPVNGIFSSDNIYFQIDEPRNRFKDFSNAQRSEWIKVYDESKKPEPVYPEWFQQRTEIEKRIWLARMEAVMAHQPNPAESDVCMGPVVKKQGLPGLRNLALSSFAIAEIDDQGRAKVKDISAKSIRSSNLIVQAQDGNRTLNENQKKLTMDNIYQVSDLYQHNNMNNNAGGFSYSEPHQPFVLCQSLLRKIGGDDDYVIGLKQNAVANINSTLDSDRYFSSNHCISAHATISKAFHLLMHMTGANTKGMQHIIAPMNHFMEDAVKRGKNAHHMQTLDALYQSALRGRYKGLTDPDTKAAFETCDLNPEQYKTLDFILRATSMYARETKSKLSFNKKHQLHMAALEEIIYQDTGNCVQSSCKSGKDREAVEKTYRNAMRAFYAAHGRLAPSGSNNEEVTGDREKFVSMFLELFMTHHQARLAELNANGCEGLKALQNILPKDIYDALLTQNKDLLKTHEENSELNEIGHTKVPPDPDELERVMTEVYFKNHETFANYNDSSSTEKTEGANNPGPYGGIYQRNDKQGYAIFKRDTKNDKIQYGKIIAEFVAGRMISAILGEMHKDDPEYANKYTATVNLVKANPRTAGESHDEKIYLQSIFLNQYQGDFWKVAYTASLTDELKTSKADLLASAPEMPKEHIQKLLAGEEEQFVEEASKKLSAKFKSKPIVTIPALLKHHQHERIRIPSTQLLINPTLHADFCDHVVVRIFVSDYGVHAGNIGPVYDKKSETTRLGSFDYGAALKNLSDEFVLFSRIGTGTAIHKNHLLEYSDDVIKSEKMAESLLKLGKVVSDEFIHQQAKDIIRSANIPYSSEAIKKFCLHIGMDEVAFKNEHNADTLLKRTEAFIARKLITRRESAIRQGCGLLLEHMANVCNKPDGSLDKAKFQQLIVHSPHREKLYYFIKTDLANYSPVLPDTKLDKSAILAASQPGQRIYRAEAVILKNLLEGASPEEMKKKLKDYIDKPGNLNLIRFIDDDLEDFIRKEREIFDKLPAQKKGVFEFEYLKNNLTVITNIAKSLQTNAPVTSAKNQHSFFKQMLTKFKKEKPAHTQDKSSKVKPGKSRGE